MPTTFITIYTGGRVKGEGAVRLLSQVVAKRIHIYLDFSAETKL